jgi:hypothetical protein
VSSPKIRGICPVAFTVSQKASRLPLATADFIRLWNSASVLKSPLAPVKGSEPAPFGISIVPAGGVGDAGAAAVGFGMDILTFEFAAGASAGRMICSRLI